MNRKIILAIFLVIQVLALIMFLIKLQYEYAYEILIIIAGALSLIWYEKRSSLSIPDYILILSLIAFSGHTIGGELLNLYATSLVYDKILHVFGSYSFAMLAYVLLGMDKLPLGRKIKFIIIMTIGVYLGTIYELWEFGLDRFLDPPLPLQSGLIDTNLDLLADLAGSTLAALHLSRR